MQKKISDFAILDHGIENNQYFQGCGTAFTRFDNVVTGCGSSAKEAFDDALESMAQMGFEASDELEAEGNTLSTVMDVPEEAEESYHYVSIRWNEQG